MEDKVRYKNQKLLKTPIVNLSISSSKGSYIPFDVLDITNEGKKYLQNLIDEYQLGELSILQYGVRISLSGLNINENYYIECDKKVEFYGSDEFVFTYNCTQNDGAFFITFPVLNDHGFFEESSKIGNPDNFEPYYIENYSNKKFLLRLNNNKAKYMYFSVCWFKYVDGVNFEVCRQVAEMGNDWFIKMVLNDIYI